MASSDSSAGGRGEEDTPRLGSCTVYLSSSDGNSPKYVAAAKILGAHFAAQGTELVYGGSNCGQMGALADAVLAAGGSVTGVTPDFFDKEEHTSLTHIIVVANMHIRKRLMFWRGDAFAALPGGIGTFEELLEVLAWAYLGSHPKPVGLLSTDGFYEPLLEMLQHGIAEGFVHEDLLHWLVVATTPEELLPALAARVGVLKTLLQMPTAVSRDPAAATFRADTGAGATEAPNSPDAPAPPSDVAQPSDEAQCRHCCVFADNGSGASPAYCTAAGELGRLLAHEEIELVHGGGGSGCARALTDATLAAGGRVVGVLPPEKGNYEVHEGLSELIRVAVPGPHGRKQALFDRSAGSVGWLVAVPGGITVWEEFLEVLSAAQLGLHTRPIGLLNAGGFYAPLLRMLERSVECGFTHPGFLDYTAHAENPAELFEKLHAYAPVRLVK